MIDDEARTRLGPALLSVSAGGLLAQMCAFKKFGNLRIQRVSFNTCVLLPHKERKQLTSPHSPG